LHGAAEAAARRRLLKQKASLVYEPLPSREACPEARSAEGFTRAFWTHSPLSHL